jgi:hypothetical protein
MRRVVLRDTRDASGTRFLEARLDPDGALRIEGQDLGPGVGEVFGAGLTEYEWWWRLDAGHVPAAVVALGGQPADDPLATVARWFADSGGTDPGSGLREAGLPIAFDCRIGD